MMLAKMVLTKFVKTKCLLITKPRRVHTRPLHGSDILGYSGK